MGNLIDLLRRNLFWAVLVLILIAIGIVYVSVGRRMEQELQKRRGDVKRDVTDLESFARRKVIPNAAMIAAAERERGQLRLLYGHLLAVFAPRSGGFEEDLRALRNKKSDNPFDNYAWWDEYEARISELARSVRDRFQAAPGIIAPANRPPDSRLSFAEAKRKQRAYWRLRALVETLAGAEQAARKARRQMAKTGAGSPTGGEGLSPPVIEELLALRVGEGGGRLRHDWLNNHAVAISVRMRFEDVPLLIAALQNAPRPVRINGYVATQPEWKPGGVIDTTTLSEIVRVDFSGELVEFTPAVQSIRFEGRPFGDLAAVRAWLAREKADLKAPMTALLERIPELRDRIPAMLGARLTVLRERIDRELEEELKEAEAVPKSRREQALEAARKKAPDGRLAPEDKARIQEEYTKLLAALQKKARVKHQRKLADLVAGAGGFEYVYDYLHKLVPQKAYLVGKRGVDRLFVIARAPDRAPEGVSGRWWFADGAKGKTVKLAWAALRTALKTQFPRHQLVAQEAVPRSPKVWFLVDPGARRVVRLIVEEPGGAWRVYRMLRVGEHTVSMSDAAFRFAHVLSVAERNLGRASGRPVQIVLPEVKLKGLSPEIQIPVAGGGVLRVKIGPRRPAG